MLAVKVRVGEGSMLVLSSLPAEMVESVSFNPEIKHCTAILRLFSIYLRKRYPAYGTSGNDGVASGPSGNTGVGCGTSGNNGVPSQVFLSMTCFRGSSPMSSRRSSRMFCGRQLPSSSSRVDWVSPTIPSVVRSWRCPSPSIV